MTTADLRGEQTRLSSIGPPVDRRGEQRVVALAIERRYVTRTRMPLDRQGSRFRARFNGQLALSCATIALASCIHVGSKAPSGEPAKDARGALATLQKSLDAALETSRAQLAHDDYVHALEVANDASRRTRLEPSRKTTEAELIETVASAMYSLHDPSCTTKFAEARQRHGEAIPGSEEEIARVSEQEGLARELFETNLVEAERLYRRALAIHEHLRGPSDASLINASQFLFDVLDQECRETEAQAELARLERIYAAHPGQPRASFHTHRFRALIARRLGNGSRAIALLLQALEELDKPTR